eukprot:COSAG06_NODE_25644_length_632_cov_0.712946_1_plen_21_part_01
MPPAYVSFVKTCCHVNAAAPA